MTSPDEPRCRNCGAAAPGAYCGACGQDTRPGLPTFAQFMREATGRYVALDGRLWRTLVPLLFGPGFLTREYVAGRRRRYIGPARLFLVASLLLFAVLRIQSDGFEAQVQLGDAGAANGSRPPAELGSAIDDDLNVALGEMGLARGALGKRIERFRHLPLRDKIEQMVAGALRYGPYAMFALLPAFAALLKVLYLGRRVPRRPRLYGEHLVFAAHTHAFLAFAGVALALAPHEIPRLAVAAWMPCYLVWALRVVYGGSWVGTFVRSAVMFVVYSVLFGFAVAGLLAAAILLR